MQVLSYLFTLHTDIISIFQNSNAYFIPKLYHNVGASDTLFILVGRSRYFHDLEWVSPLFSRTKPIAYLSCFICIRDRLSLHSGWVRTYLSHHLILWSRGMSWTYVCTWVSNLYTLPYDLSYAMTYVIYIYTSTYVFIFVLPLMLD